MNEGLWACVLTVLSAMSVTPVFAQQAVPQALSLYEGRIPNSIDAPDEEAVRDPKEVYPFLQNISRPTITPYLVKATNATAVIILPGGSYRGVSHIKEGHEVALEFNKIGIAAFVLKYRTPSAQTMRDRSEGPLQDIEQAIRVVRARAGEWRVNPERVGVMGFSAGGHLASLAATRFVRPVIRQAGASARPDFALLIYPVISMLDPITHATSRQQLLGEGSSIELQRAYSTDLLVTAETPPTFIVHASDDRSVKVDNSLRFYAALQARGVPAEMHIYTRGGHGFGLRNATTTELWFDRAHAWLESQGYIGN